MYKQNQSYYNTKRPYPFIGVVVPFIIGAWLGGLRNSRADIHQGSLESRL